MNDLLLGVMQGRLLPKYQGRYQAHPVDYWQQEFPLAAELGLDLIEFILDYYEVEKNPLMSGEGVEEILKVSEQTGILVKTICADYFMEAPIHSPNDEITQKSQRTLCNLLENVSDFGVTDIVIPCVDHSCLRHEKDIQRFIQAIGPSVELAEKFNINLSLETDLSPEDFVSLLEQLDSKRVTVNYDTGNSAALGYDVREELATYGDYITDIHIKDRVYQGGSVELGTGDTDFNLFFETLNQIDFQGPLIMQAYRDEEGVKIFKKQLEWIKPKFNRMKNREATC